jgi:heme-degrading monooxygenase HmoA
MFAALYRWEIKPGMEEQFVEGWRRVTLAIHEACGSYGSRLHRSADGTWFGYARWPDAATRDACSHGETEGLRLMREATERMEEFSGDVVVDLLREPAGP